jgi:hypothetical protein
MTPPGAVAIQCGDVEPLVGHAACRSSRGGRAGGGRRRIRQRDLTAATARRRAAGQSPPAARRRAGAGGATATEGGAEGAEVALQLRREVEEEAAEEADAEGVSGRLPRRRYSSQSGNAAATVVEALQAWRGGGGTRRARRASWSCCRGSRGPPAILWGPGRALQPPGREVAQRPRSAEAAVVREAWCRS